MKTSVSIVYWVLLVSTLSCLVTTQAWVIPHEILQRYTAAAAISATIITSPLVANSVDFAGSYSDPFHTNCQRIIVVPTPNTAILYGTDGNPGCPVDGSGNSWELTGTIDGNNILVDFTPKGGPKNLKGTFDTDGIKWPDGNKWTKKSL